MYRETEMERQPSKMTEDLGALAESSESGEDDYVLEYGSRSQFPLFTRKVKIDLYDSRCNPSQMNGDP